MVRPRADNYEERRQGLLDGAAKMFAEHGFDGTSIADIARGLGISKALLYHYYQSKEAILYDMLHSHCRLLVETTSQAARQAAQAEDQLGNVVRALMGLYVTSRDKHVVLLNNLHCLPPAQQEEIKRLEKQVVQVIKDLVAELSPDLPAPAVTSLTMYLMGAINWTYTWFKAEGAVSEKRFAELAIETFLYGVYGKRACK